MQHVCVASVLVVAKVCMYKHQITLWQFFPFSAEVLRENTKQRIFLLLVVQSLQQYYSLY